MPKQDADRPKTKEPYHIPGTEGGEPTQPKEHPNVVHRSWIAIFVAGFAALVALLAALFAGLQWKISVKALDLAQESFLSEQRPVLTLVL